MMRLRPLRWDPRLEATIGDIASQPLDITEKLEKQGIDRETLSTELYLTGSELGKPKVVIIAFQTL